MKKYNWTYTIQCITTIIMQNKTKSKIKNLICAVLW